MRYLLDTDIVSNPLKKNPSASLLSRLGLVQTKDLYTSSITVGEMNYGALRGPRAEEFVQRLERELWPNYQILDFDAAAARVYARIRVLLERRGAGLDEPDLRIAAIALDRRLTLVTGNLRHFERIDGLSVENWLE